ncbi:MAG: NAD(P)-dependent oxidoreductase [Candidatus Heimdallarchaeota archaeon]
MRETTVLFTRGLSTRLIEHLKTCLHHTQGLNLIFLEDPIKTEDLLEFAPQTDIMVGWRVPDEVKLAATKMKLFINPGAGIKHHITFFRELNKTRKVTLVNGHGNSYFTAQHAVALLLGMTNHIVPHHNWMSQGLWRKGDSDAASIPLRNRRIGLLGYGAINTKVHDFLKGFHVEFSILRYQWPDESISLPTPVKKFSLSELSDFLTEIDILIIAVPETTKTVGMIGTEELKKLGPKGLLVNVSRGSVIDEKSLFNALRTRTIAGAAIDVWYDYQPDPDENGHKHPFHYPFHSLPNIILSPHRGASPFSDLKRWDEVIENIKRFHGGESKFLNEIDLEREY